MPRSFFSPRTLAALLALFASGFCETASAAPSSKFDKNAQLLAKSLAPSPAAKKANPEDLKKLKSRMISLIEVIEESDRSGSTNAESLMNKAMYFREDMGDYEKMVTSNAILNVWEDASHYGLFNESGKFEERITSGRHSGDPVIFELIVPAHRYPKGSNQLANLRIVPLKEKRKDGEEMDARDLAFGHQLVKLIDEKESFAAMQKREAPVATNSLGETREQSKESWERALAESEGALERVPRIRIESSINGSPSKMNQYRWRLTTNIRNASVHPTEVKVTVYMLGQTENTSAYYFLAKKEHTLQLRQNEIREIETFTKSEATYKHKVGILDGLPKKSAKNGEVDYRGNVVIAKHKDKVVAIHGSDSRLLKYADENNKEFSLAGIPSFF
ncbi:MAG: hypothetical protein P1U86_20790 [Verrucomicrobiales bacterium]|nr:hypothetical protein [Verrucomicrobiales bacterium]